MEYLRSNRKYLIGILMILLLLIIYSCKPTKSLEQPKVQPVVTLETTVGVTKKISPTDNDVELTQIYKAEVNGSTVEIPVETKDNIKGVIKQTVDLTPVTQMQRELDKKEFKKNWEVGVGIGIHNGDVYVPLEIQRNYTPDNAISIEVHIKPDLQQPKVTGGELKHKWMF